jgi:tripartite ATP-independent transporter DctM subunit
MSGIELGLAGFAAVIALMFLRIPIGISMLAVGMLGYVYIAGPLPLLNHLKSAAYSRFSNYDLSVIPLFLLMGQFASRAGMSRALFRFAGVFLGHLRGGLAMAAIGACAGFGAICGSSLATAATMGQVALPELRRMKYSAPLATGTLAAGGTLGILIPPSVVLVVYAILTEQNIAKLFLAAFLPGIVATIGYMTVIAVYVRLKPGSGPAAPRATAAERLKSFKDVWPVALIFLLVIGGMYRGWFTPTEGAAVGAFGTGMLALLSGGLDRRGLIEAMLGTAESTAMIFLILFGADILNVFLALTQMPAEAARLIAGSGLQPMLVLIAMLLLYLALGCVMDSLSMILLTIPIFFPIIMGLDFGLPPEDTAIWFGILILSVVEIGLITPPVGLNVFVISGLAKDVPMYETFKGVSAFLLSDLVRVTLLVFVPPISLVALWLLR